MSQSAWEYSHKAFPLYYFICRFLWCKNQSVSDPGLPSGEEAAEVFGVHRLLNEEVYLATHAEHRPVLNTLQLLLQAQQHSLRHFIKALTVTAQTQHTITVLQASFAAGIQSAMKINMALHWRNVYTSLIHLYFHLKPSFRLGCVYSSDHDSYQIYTAVQR